MQKFSLAMHSIGIKSNERCLHGFDEHIYYAMVAWVLMTVARIVRRVLTSTRHIVCGSALVWHKVHKCSHFTPAKAEVMATPRESEFGTTEKLEVNVREMCAVLFGS